MLRLWAVIFLTRLTEECSSACHPALSSFAVAFAKADKNADGKLTLAEEREFATLVGVDSDEFKNAKIKATGQADEARAKDKEAKKKAELDAKNKQIESTGGGNLRLNRDGTTRGRGL